MFKIKSENRCTACVRKVSWIGLWYSFVLSLLKGFVGIISGSHALMGSALYSFHDVVSSIAILIGLKIFTKPTTKNYPYGYGNAEYIVSVFISIIILTATIFLMYNSIKLIFIDHKDVTLHWSVVLAAAFSIFFNILLYKFNKCAFKHLNSPAILTHAKHLMADAISSMAVILVILGTSLGIHSLDPLAAIFETVHLIYLSGEILIHGCTGLMDKAIDKKKIVSIKDILADVSGIEKIKTRQVGRNINVELFISFPADKTLNEIHAISNKITETIKNNMKYIGNVNVIYV